MSAAPGCVVDAEGELVVAAGAGGLALLELQAAGKRALAADDFLRGVRLAPGDTLGDAPGD